MVGAKAYQKRHAKARQRRRRSTPPPNVALETFVPHTAVLPHVDAMLTQCGLGTLMKTLAHGVPLVCIPLVGDQPDNAARVVARGAGLRVPADAPSGRIREAIERVVTDPSFRHAAHQLATRMAEEDPVQAAVDGLLPISELAQFILDCSSTKWSKHVTNSPFLARLATAGSSAASKIISACSNAVS
jgi:UDP-N-acetylglucosamine:LPS N-acetylglucosamine transferase